MYIPEIVKEVYRMSDQDWYPMDYDPHITADTWLSLLADETVFTPNSLQIIKRIKDYGGMATCTQLSVK